LVDGASKTIYYLVIRFLRRDTEMVSFNIMLNSIADVKDFVNAMSKSVYDIDLVSGRYIVDAKSIMGIFSLDLTKPITVNVHCDECDSLIQEIGKYKV
jgi:hypothetical protein